MKNTDPKTDTGNELNLDVLAQMIERLPPQTARQLFDKLYQECDRLLTVLRDESLEIDETASTSHEFKGMLGNFGLSNASSVAEEIEHCQKPARAVVDIVQRLELAIAQEIQQVEEILKRNG